MARLGWFCPVVSEPVKPYFTRFLRVLTFCLGASKIVIFCENGVVNGVVKWAVISMETYSNPRKYYSKDCVAERERQGRQLMACRGTSKLADAGFRILMHWIWCDISLDCYK